MRSGAIRLTVIRSCIRFLLQPSDQIQGVCKDRGAGVDLEWCQVIQLNLGGIASHVGVHEGPVFTHPDVENVLDHGPDLLRPGHVLWGLSDDQFCFWNQWNI